MGPQASEHYDLGVLVVHGIGEQKRGATLTQWADGLVTWFATWNSRDELSTPTRAALTSARLKTDPGEPPNVTMDLEFAAGAQHDHRWLLAEAWWAGAFDPPKFIELWSWSFKSVPATAAMHANGLIGSALRRRRQRTGWARTIQDLRLLVLIVFLLLLVLISPIVLALLTGLLIVGYLAAALPLPGLKEAVVRAQLIAIGTIGDSQRLVESPTQAAAIKSPVVEGLQWLRQNGCRRILVIAHSQGAAIGYKALLDLADGHHGPFDPIDTFVSIGSGLPKVNALEHLSEQQGLQSVRTAALAVPAAALVTVLCVRHLVLQRGIVAMIGMATIAGVCSIWTIIQIVRKRREPGPTVGGLGTIVSIVDRSTSLLPVVIGLVVAVVWSALVGQGMVALVALISFGVGLISLASIALFEPPPIEGEPGRAARRWLDLYATKDPVPSGATRTTVPGWPESRQVSNLGSFSRDHTSYVYNADECLTYVGIELLEASGVEIQGSAMRSDNANYGHRRRWRVGWRGFVTLALLVAVAVFAYNVWGGPDHQVQATYESLFGYYGSVGAWIPGGIPDVVPLTIGTTTAQVVSVFGFVSLSAVVIGIGQALWASWDRREVLREVRSSAYQDDDVPLQFRLMFAYLALMIAIALRPRWAWSTWRRLDFTTWGSVISVVLVVGFVFAVGRFLPQLLSRSGVRQFVVGRNMTGVDSLLSFGHYQLSLDNPAAAVATFEKAKVEAERAELRRRGDPTVDLDGVVRADSDVLGALGLGKDRLAQQLRARLAECPTGNPRAVADDERRIVALEADAARAFAAATQSDRSPSVETLVRYANFLAAVRGDHPAARVMLDRAAKRDPRNGSYLAAQVAHRYRIGDPTLLAVTPESMAAQSHASLLPEQKFELTFHLLALKGPQVDTSVEREAIESMLKRGNCVGVDLRTVLAKLPGGWSQAQEQELRDLAQRITGRATATSSSARRVLDLRRRGQRSAAKPQAVALSD